jgi:endonuclease/exonuclease/phosphatase (EEP) superfamily protein YafD
MTSDKHKKMATSLSKSLLFISTLLCFALFLVYIVEPDLCAAITFWPIWISAIPGIALALIAASTNKKTGLAIILIWLLLVVIMAEEPLSLLRSCLYFNRDCKNSCPTGRCLRVISFNCASANFDVAEELIRYAPDIVLLQESPRGKDIETLTQKLFSGRGEFALEGDTAILARGRVRKADVGGKCCFFMIAARVYLFSGLEIETISVHLAPPTAAVNLLSPACWREHFKDRRQRLKEIISIEKHLETITPNVPLIVGGDFNAVLWRKANKVLSSKLNDTFQQSGIGWPGTGPAHFPLWRIDQIWVSKHFKPVKVWSEPSKNSDHRIVICDLCAL